MWGPPGRVLVEGGRGGLVQASCSNPCPSTRGQLTVPSPPPPPLGVVVAVAAGGVRSVFGSAGIGGAGDGGGGVGGGVGRCAVLYRCTAVIVGGGGGGGGGGFCGSGGSYVVCIDYRMAVYYIYHLLCAVCISYGGIGRC